tara:strand:- start:2795 stop:4084 length:1290 start_codon:yes stop_codon:yes gene_type:complete
MKSPLSKGIGQVITDYGTRVMRIFKTGLQRSLFDFFGDVKANTFRIKESSSVPTTPLDDDGGVLYTKASDGKLYYKSNEVSEFDITSSHASGTVSSVGSAGTVNGVTLTGTVTSSGDLTLGGTLAVNNSDWSGTDLSVGNGGTGASSHLDNSLLIGNGTDAVQSTSELQYSSETLSIGALDNGPSFIKRREGHNSNGGTLAIYAGEGEGTDKAGGLLRLYGGQSTGTGVGGNIVFYTTPAGGSSNSTVNSAVAVGCVDVGGHAQFDGSLTAKQRTVYTNSFQDDLSTSLHFIPFATNTEQTTRYQEEVAIIAPCDGRIVSVTVRVRSISGSGDMTVGVQTCPPGVSSYTTGNWNVEETETLTLASTDDDHVFHFGFSNDKHFESTEMFAVSIQNDTDLSGTNYWWVTTVVEWDYNTMLSTTSAEYDTAP